MSNTSPPEAAGIGLEGIVAAAESANRTAGLATDAQRIHELETRLAGIEPLLEQLQSNSKIAVNLAAYVDGLRAEQVFFNRARTALGCLSGISIIGLISLLGLAIFHPVSPLLKAPPVAIATFVVGLVSGIVFLMSAFAKGLFRSTAERHSDGFLPPSLVTMGEAFSRIVGKG